MSATVDLLRDTIALQNAAYIAVTDAARELERKRCAALVLSYREGDNSERDKLLDCIAAKIVGGARDSATEAQQAALRG